MPSAVARLRRSSSDEELELERESLQSLPNSAATTPLFSPTLESISSSNFMSAVKGGRSSFSDVMTGLAIAIVVEDQVEVKMRLF